MPEKIKNKISNKEEVFVVIPAYNAEKTIEKVISDVQKEGYFNIVVVDDGSKDNTFQKVEKKNVFVLKHIINRGQGAALRTGDRFALKEGAKVIVHFDADGQMLAEDINEIVNPIIKKEVVIVFGSRYMGKKAENMPKSKRVVHWLARIFMKLVYGVPHTDPQSGFRAFDSEFKNKVEIEFDRMEHCSEILQKTHKKKIKYMEVPVKIIYTEESNKGSTHGTIPLISGFKMAFNMLIKNRRKK